MKKKNFYGLWAAALLMMAGGCSEELDGGDDVDTGGDGKGDKAYITVQISSPSTGARTKADSANPDGGEGGDGDAQGTADENYISDVNIFLYEANSEDESDDNIELADKDIVGRGYSELTSDENNPTHNSDNHTAQATVEINIPKLGEEVKYYNILTVTNAGTMPAFTTVAQLRDYLFTEDAWSNTDSKITNFVMSTHTMSLGENKSIVGLSKENNSSEKAAKVSVYVERLAARIDLKLKEKYSITSSATNTRAVTDEIATVELTDISVVNQLKAGSYLFKRVSETVEGDNNTDKKSISTTDRSNDIYLGDEEWAGASSQGNYNYVIDPWTRGKDGALFDGDSYSSVPLALHYKNIGESQTGSTSFEELYINHFNIDLNKTSESAFTKYSEFPNAAVGASSDDYGSTEGYRRIAYTLENTADWQQQLNGFSTGVIFKGTYTPVEVTKYQIKGEDVGSNQPDGYVEGFGFYTNNSIKDAKTTVIYADLKSLLVGSFSDGDNIGDVVKALFGGADDATTTVTKKAVKDAVAKLQGNFGEAYKEFVEKEIGSSDGSDGSDGSVDDIDAIDYDAFLKSLKQNNSGIETDAEALAKDYDIHYYADGTCYYKYWIRHANNGQNPPDNPNMGIMEYGIVRNNLYKLEVSKITKLGDPLPFTPGVDKSENPNEDDKSQYYIEVKIYVKDWVIRNNGDIEL